MDMNEIARLECKVYDNLDFKHALRKYRSIKAELVDWDDYRGMDRYRPADSPRTRHLEIIEHSLMYRILGAVDECVGIHDRDMMYDLLINLYPYWKVAGMYKKKECYLKRRVAIAIKEQDEREAERKEWNRAHGM